MNLPRHLQRRLALVPVLVAHAAVLALVIGGSASGVGKAPAPRVLTLIYVRPPVPSERVQAKPHPFATSAAIVPAVRPLPVAAEAVLPDPAPMLALSEASLAPGESCDIPARLQAALRDDPKARAALGMLPRDARSVANAVMLWDGRWIAGTTTSTRYALDQVRMAVLATVAAVPASCRLEAQAGPALVLLTGSPDMVLALGSGRWRWTDMFGADAETVTSVASRGDAAPAPAT